MHEIISEINKLKRFNEMLLELVDYLGINNQSATDIMFILSDLSERHTELVKSLNVVDGVKGNSIPTVVT